MMAGYLAGGPYLAFAKDAGLVPPDATRATHEAMRERCKVVVLGINYGMGPEAMARQAGITVPEARELLMLHKRTYPVFWRWIQSVLDAAMLTNEIQSVFGWRRQVTPETKPTSLMNFPMQANGAEMMRVAAIAATEAGIEVCAPVHDAFLIAAPLGRLDEQVEAMQAIMAGAGRVITRGLDVRTEAKIVRWPDRYMDERGQAMWDRVMSLLDRT
jgi:DNA polymerase I-like protein with 3'-5' exonuclease and polymerase domains